MLTLNQSLKNEMKLSSSSSPFFKLIIRIPLHESLEILNTHPSLYLELSDSGRRHDGDDTPADIDSERL